MDLLSVFIFLLIELIGTAIGYYTPLAGLFLSIALIYELGFNDYFYFFLIGLSLGAAIREANKNKDRRC